MKPRTTLLHPLVGDAPIEDLRAVRFLASAWRWIASRPWTGLLASTIVHVILFLLLAIWAVDQRGGDSGSVLDASTGDDASADVVDLTTVTGDLTAPSIEDGLSSQLTASPSLATNISPAIEPSMQIAQPSITAPSGLGPISQLENLRSANAAGLGRLFREVGIEGRSRSKRGELAGKRGGNAASEKAVEDAIVWLANHQMADGGWSLAFNVPPCNGQCSHPTHDLDPKRAAATGLALMTFLGAGYTHKEGKYKQEVQKGLYFLISIMQRLPEGGRFPSAISEFLMYEQGIATLALCEAYQMSSDKELKNECQQAINFIINAQTVDGGWGYEPKKIPADLSIACWQIMAIKSAHASGLELGNNTVLGRFDRFLNSQQSDNGAKYGYAVYVVNRPRTSMTAIGLLMRMYRGWDRTDPRLLSGINYFIKDGFSQRDVYFNFYASQVLFHQEGNYWADWNPKLRDYLISTQATRGHEAGSWFFEGNGNNEAGGRLYCTTMSALTLEVYYRHMPIYGRIQQDDFQL